MGWTGWLAAAVGAPLAAVLLTLAAWTLRLWLGVRRRGGIPPYGHPEPAPLPEYVRQDLFRVRRRDSPTDPRPR